jgi:hypothetical protein
MSIANWLKSLWEGDAQKTERVADANQVAQTVGKLAPRQSRWVDVPEGKIYLRRAKHPGIGETIDIPNVAFGPRQRRLYPVSSRDRSRSSAPGSTASMSKTFSTRAWRDFFEDTDTTTSRHGRPARRASTRGFQISTVATKFQISPAAMCFRGWVPRRQHLRCQM